MNPSPHFEITFLRHGQSVGNAEGWVQGQRDYPLTADGRAQAQALGDRWLAEGRQFDQVIASPLPRARETAEIIAGALNLPLEFDPLWKERDAGKRAGLKHADANQQYPRPEFISLFHRMAETGESELLLTMRAGQAIQSLLRRPSGRYLVVSHGGLLNKIFHLVLGLTPQPNFKGPSFFLGNTGFSHTRYHPATHNWDISAHNDRAHLDHPLRLNSEHQFVLLRHGESEGNVQQLFQGQADFPLTASGRAQAQALADRWQAEEINFDQVIASPISRALDTAKTIAQQLDIPLEIDERLKEVDNGKMAGLNHEQIEAQFSPRQDAENPYAPLGETGESWWDLHLRASDILHDLMQRPPGKYLIVAHGGLLNTLLAAMLGIQPRNQQTPWFHFGNTAFAVIGYTESDNIWRLNRAGDHQHTHKLKENKAWTS